jgi:hypothetical protein
MDFPENPNSESADAVVALIQKQMHQLSEELGPGQSIEAVVPAPGGGKIFVTWFGHHNPDFIKITGLDADGSDVCLLAHKNTLQVLLKKVNNESETGPQVSFQTPEMASASQITFDESA